MSTHQIHIFISHSWKYSNHYDTLSEWIFDGNWSVGQASLDFRDFSVPKDDPIHDAKNTSELQKAIYNQISKSHIIIIPTGMYASYSQWIQKEIDGSKLYNKPILAVNPWGQERASSIVKANSKKYVGWNKEPLIQAIWDLYKQLP